MWRFWRAFYQDARQHLAPQYRGVDLRHLHGDIRASILYEGCDEGVSESSIAIRDNRLELAALLYDQEGVQEVIDLLAAVKALLPEKVDAPTKEAAN
jgi:hypothetical protein